MSSVVLILLFGIRIMDNAAQPVVELQIFAASSLIDSFTELANAYQAKNNIDVVLNFAGSSTLAAQIQQGAPSDIFASANVKQVQNLVDDALVTVESVSTFAHNALILITPVDNPADIITVHDVSKPNILLIIASPTVPIREYTDILLQNLDIYYQYSISDAISANVVSEEPNVRQLVAKVALGEADAAFVYRTDITPDVADTLQVIELPLGTSPIADYVIVPISESPHVDAAQDFIDFVLSDEGQTILESWGFCRVDGEVMPELTPESTPDNDLNPEIDAEVACA